MSTRLILNESAKKQIVTDSLGISRLKDARVAFENGVPYIALSGDILSPIFTAYAQDYSIVSRVTYTTSFAEGFRPEGLYANDDCTARVQTQVSPSRHQIISISGPTIPDVKEMYYQVRGGALKPDTNWHVAYEDLKAAAKNQDH